VSIELTLLGRVRGRGEEITGTRLLGLLALLADPPGAACPTARLVADLWPDEQPEHPARAVQVLVARARAKLGADVIENTAAGYRLTLDHDQVDASAVVRHASASERHARAGEHEASLAAADAGLALFADATEVDGADPLARLRMARARTRSALLRLRALALARLGRRSDALGPLGGLAAEHPRDEEVLAELLRCEAAVLGPAAALEHYETYRQELRDELGADPGDALREVHAELMRLDVPVVRHGVLAEPNPLLGRDNDVARVTLLLRAARVTSITGPGGLGKTRLAHAVARAAEHRVVRFVPLAGVATDQEVAAEVAAVLGVGERGPGPIVRGGAGDLVAGIVAALAPGPALLVLDNCEHVVSGVADLVGAVVAMSADVCVLATSRSPLGLSAESVYPLPGLGASASAELFVARARAARPDVELAPDAVRAVCAQLDGLPLGVELAAARVRVMSVPEIARRIGDRFALLRGGARDAPQRHRTLHAVIDWSWQLLDPSAQAAVRALSVFPGGFDEAAAARVLDDGAVLDVLERLVDQSLLQVSDTGGGTRFRMLETVREFGTARRVDAGETEVVLNRFLCWATEFGQQWPESVFGRDVVAFTAAARREQDNLVQALRIGLDRGDGAVVAATTAVLAGLWVVDTNFARLKDFGTDTAWVLSHHRPAPELVEVTRTSVVLAAMSAFLIQNTPPARLLVTLRRIPGAPPATTIGAAQVVLGTVTEGVDALIALRDNENAWIAGFANYALSYVLEFDNDLAGALAAARRALPMAEQDDNPWMPVAAHARVGELCLLVEPGEAALVHLTYAVQALERLGAIANLERVRPAIAMANMQSGAVDETERVLDQVRRGAVQDGADLPMFDTAARAEILLARGDVGKGLADWRAAAERAVPSASGGFDAWPLELQAVCVIAHARHDAVAEVADLVATLLGAVHRVLDRSATRPAEFPLCGTMLVALALGGPGTAGQVARLIALAERMHYVRVFQPTMSPELIRAAAQDADRRAYEDAVSSYARLDHAGLRRQALDLLAALAERAAISGRRPG
jgi:predicted ATPase/DNA-binding SARP family transcriptional activator